METKRFNVGDRVCPKGHTRDGLTHGYVRAITDDRGYRIYWPEIRESAGEECDDGDGCGDGWGDSDLE